MDSISIIAARLRSLAEGRDWAAMTAFLGSLSNSGRRSAAIVLSETVLPALEEETFWSLALCLVRHDAKAYLGTVMKAAPAVISEAFAMYLATEGTAIDIRKTVEALLPRQATPEGIERLFSLLDIADPRMRAKYLIHCPTLPSAFILFQAMRQMDTERDTLLSICRRLISDNTTIGWSLASLSRTYFDLPELHGTFSLKLHPYELSHLENSYEAFAAKMDVR